MAVQFAYPWNKPRSAIASPYLTYDQQHRRDRMFAALLHARKVLSLQPECVRFDVYRTAAVLEQNQGSQRANAFLISFCKKALPRLELVAKKYECVGIDSKVSAAVFGGHFDTELRQYLASRMVNMVARFNRLPDMSRADIDLLAADIANFIRAELADIDDTGFSELKTLYTWYIRAGFISLQFNVTPPHWDRVTKKYVGQDEIAPAVMRMFNEVWWRGRLRRIAASWREHLQIAVGNVSKKRHAYASKNCVTDWREQKRRTREFLKGLDLEDEDGNRISLIEKYDGSVANPAIRRCELMTRIRGFENICNELGYVGEFYTLTAPSKYHATIKAGYRNSKWNGASPSDTQSYLTGLWARIRSKLHREEIRIFGIRVAEPHHDGTPHWHMLMFMLPEDVERVRLIIRDYAWEEDLHELRSDKAKKARFHAEAIDPEKGSATGYVAKYISKNIDGYALDGETDDESGELLKETAPAVSAWAARWHIRQFQFIGGAPVTVYRELRRLADTETAHGLSVEFAAVHDAADAGDWAGYVNAQGGPFVRRDDLQVRTLYEPRAESNQYGEETVCIRGVYDSAVGAGTPILTRLTQWKIVPKRAVDLAVDVKGAPAPSRSSVNNCTGSESDPPKLDLSKPLSRRERRELTNRLRKPKPAMRRKFIHGTDEQNAAIAKTIDEIHLTTGITISRGEALHLIAGGKSCFDGKWLRGTATGEIFTAAPSHQAKAKEHQTKATEILNRVAALAELATKA
ncbi:replication endonuclease [Salmonella enterica subsp. enterica serovar Weltevreden]|nr:replication endonuclease [Salmonella enterica subsp. enterica serovar Weltevreden]EDV1482664.1 replication endonuclease [Salmonella enterica subsp. enterica]EBY7667960.1 replication endonuclease [Salmonella enterica subsp. enterica serovar Weltevreden]ECD5684943.1 replication endonuclease [Salmonella enterica subsp. enterica serovar Weltevreden]ECK9437519.1 replication endonuclease [Salmonella enterica subsp. enterica serovar Weltevreden]